MMYMMKYFINTNLNKKRRCGREKGLSRFFNGLFVVTVFLFSFFLVVNPVYGTDTGKKPSVEGESAESAFSIETVVSIPVETTLGYEGAGKAVDTWVDMIDSAKKTLDIGQFYLSTKKGEPLEPVIQSIIKAADRGVTVRFLVGPVNKSMKTNTQQVLNRFKNHDNISVTMFNWKELTGGILHAKYFIVDRKEVFVGSQNFDWRALKHIHETGLRIKSPTFADALTRIFEADLRFNNGDKASYDKLKKQTPIAFSQDHTLVSSPDEYNPPGIPSAIKTLIKIIDNAQSKITIQLLKYHEDRYRSKEAWTIITDALVRAGKRGVKVKMMVADWQKERPGLDVLKKLDQIPNIQVKIVTIPQSKEGNIPYARVIHSKVMRVDKDISWVGTSNWGYDYFITSRNIEIVTHDATVAQTLDRLFQALWTSDYVSPCQ